MKRFNPIDKVILANLIYIALLAFIFGRPLAGYTQVFTGNAIVALAVLGLVFFVPMGKSRVTDILRAAYPALLFGYFYNQTGGLIHLFYPEFLDSGLTAWEAQVFGGNITVWLDRNFLGSGAVTTLVTEVLSGCYFMYYLMMPLVIIPLLAMKRYNQIGEILTAASITFSVSFNLFWLYPIEGPRWHFASIYTHDITGPFFREMVQYIIHNGAVHGGAMPSTHTGVALVFLVYLYRLYRPWFYVALPIVVGIALGAVYGRFHYISDIIVGAAIAAVCIALTIRYYPKWSGARE